MEKNKPTGVIQSPEPDDEIVVAIIEAIKHSKIHFSSIDFPNFKHLAEKLFTQKNTRLIFEVSG